MPKSGDGQELFVGRSVPTYMGSGRDEAEEEGRPPEHAGPCRPWREEFGFYPGGTRELPEGVFPGVWSMGWRS